jgi:ethanolamine permease
MGPWGGFLTGLAENAEYVITTAVVGGAIALLAQSTIADLFNITGTPWWNSEPFWWAAFYIVFLAINISGVEATFRFTVGITVVAMGILIVFYIAALVSGKFSSDLWFNIADGGGAAPAGAGPFLPFGISGIFKALPFAIWFYLAIEEVPLAAEESMDPRRDVPKGTIRGMHTLLLLSIGVLLLNTGVGGGAITLGESGTPLFDGFKAIFGEGTGAVLLGMMGLVGLIASFFTIMYAYGRNTYSLSRAGYFPKFLSVTHKTRKTPHVALIAGAIVGYAVLWVVWYLGRQEGDIGAKVVAAVLNMAVFAAVLAYVLQCISFVLLRKNMPNIERPYRSKWGVAGAYIAGVIALVALVSIFLNEDYRPGVYGVAVYFILGIIYFAVAGRHRLVLSPEEEFALTAGEKGVPEAEGYSSSAEEQESILRGDQDRPSTPESSG